MLMFSQQTYIIILSIPLSQATLQSCVLNTTNNCTLACEHGETFSHTLLPLYIAGILGCFWALAIICDTFFVPALEIMAEWCNFSDDIAGATFMAAGGSAPELFTSLIGTFKRSEVGFNTIVGSAVFNVLFVIGACVLFQKSVMHLTAWPLMRDCSYYTCSLIVLAFFFKVISPDVIEWWEATILFMMYLFYIYIMKNNAQLEDYVVQKGFLAKRPNNNGPTTFRARILQRMLHNSNINDSVNALVVNQLVGDVNTTFNTIDTNKDGVIQPDELYTMIHTLQECDLNHQQCQEVFNTIDLNNDGVISMEEFTKWYLTSVPRLEHILTEDFNQMSTEGKVSMEQVNIYIGETLFNSLEESTHVDLTTFIEKVKSSLKWNTLQDKAEEEADVLEGFKEQLRIPESYCGKCLWVITILPLFLFWLTIPDVSMPAKRRLCILAFINSILWIGFISYWMVEWATLLGNTVGIPINVMGLTFLAMGTSVPDLISSVIVARQGKGDMAISSSIGSNIFDILVGLPLPWLSFSLYTSESVKIVSQNLGISLGVLIFMLIMVVASIQVCKWKTEPQLAWIMMVFYLIFLGQDLARSSWDC
tara:strand:- start:720 stop:2492 length:1773 start_codon:yes stop_codon:yes gene_type:complete